MQLCQGRHGQNGSQRMFSPYLASGFGKNEKGKHKASPSGIHICLGAWQGVYLRMSAPCSISNMAGVRSPSEVMLLALPGKRLSMIVAPMPMP